MYEGINEEKVLKELRIIASCCDFEEKKRTDEIEKEMFADWAADIREASRLIEILDARIKPAKITHEATLYRCPTCPTCKNVVGDFEEFGNGKVFIRPAHCHFCGQGLDWSEFTLDEKFVKEKNIIL